LHKFFSEEAVAARGRLKENTHPDMWANTHASRPTSLQLTLSVASASSVLGIYGQLQLPEPCFPLTVACRERKLHFPWSLHLRIVRPFKIKSQGRLAGTISLCLQKSEMKPQVKGCKEKWAK
jgi:hypothetical protein